MKQRIYLRVGKVGTGKVKIDATIKPNYESLFVGSTYSKRYISTVTVALDIDIPDKEFEATRILLESKIQETIPAVHINQVQNNEM